MSTPIYDQMMVEQFDREVDEYVARFESEDVDAMLTREDATAYRGGFPERVAGWFIAAVAAFLTVGVLITLGQIVWGWVA